jgi:hypothetical protein
MLSATEVTCKVGEIVTGINALSRLFIVVKK